MNIFLVEALARAAAALDSTRENGQYDLETIAGGRAYDDSIMAQRLLEGMIRNEMSDK
jgi:hypothetical protein